jgi:hypothetical protein
VTARSVPQSKPIFSAYLLPFHEAFPKKQGSISYFFKVYASVGTSLLAWVLIFFFFLFIAESRFRYLIVTSRVKVPKKTKLVIERGRPLERFLHYSTSNKTLKKPN